MCYQALTHYYWFMPETSQRELLNLGVNNALTAESSAEVNVMLDTARATTTVESFAINLCASEIKPSSHEGSKLHLKATEEIHEK